MLKTLKCAALALASTGMIIPQHVVAAGPATTTTKAQTTDVRLVGGVLAGRVVNADGQGAATTVAVYRGTEEIARTETSADGIYRVSHLQPGSYTVCTPECAGSVRLWEGAAPPQAHGSLTISHGSVVRGNRGGLFGGGLGGSMGGVVLGVAAVAGTAVAVSVAADDDDDAPAPVSP